MPRLWLYKPLLLVVGSTVLFCRTSHRSHRGAFSVRHPRDANVKPWSTHVVATHGIEVGHFQNGTMLTEPTTRDNNIISDALQYSNIWTQFLLLRFGHVQWTKQQQQKTVDWNYTRGVTFCDEYGMDSLSPPVLRAPHCGCMIYPPSTC